MARDTPVNAWKPGDPIVFGASSQQRAQNQRRASPSSGQQSGILQVAGTSNNPGAAMKQQPIPAEWSASSWKPGMAIDFEKQLAQNKAIPAKRAVMQPIKPAQPVSQPNLRQYLAPVNAVQRGNNASKEASVVTKNDVIYIEDSFEISAANATQGESSAAANSSIEFLSHHDHTAAALKHSALLHANLLESKRKQLEAEQLYKSLQRSARFDAANDTNQQTEPVWIPRRCHFGATGTTTSRAYMSTSTRSQQAESAILAEFDWNDPLVAVASRPVNVQIEPTQEEFDDDDLPELPPVQTIEQAITGLPLKSSRSVKSRSTSAAAKQATLLEKQAAREAKAAKKAESEAKKAEKQSEMEYMQSKYPEFSYDQGNWVTPKVWYYRGEQATFILCDSKPGVAETEQKSLEEVVAGLQGPLGFDLEWNMWTARSPFGRQWKGAQGQTGLIQVGDMNNIVLYQLGSSRVIPKCLLDIIENPDVLKMGVQITGDGRKLTRDFGATPAGFLELSDIAKAIEPVKMGNISHNIALQKLVAHFLERYLDKGDARTSNWNLPVLSTSQRKYAANDVFSAVMLYRRMIGHAEIDGIELDISRAVSDAHKVVQSTGAMEWKWRKRSNAAVRRMSNASLPVAAESTEAPQKKATRPRAVLKPRVSAAVTPRQSEAWTLWHEEQKDRAEIAQIMGIKETSVCSYIFAAFTADDSLGYDADRLRALMANMYIRRDATATLSKLLGEEVLPGIDGVIPEKTGDSSASE